MKISDKIQSGFTLIEIAIVLIIVSILLGYTLAMFPIQQELKQYRSADAEMDEIINELIAFAQVNGRLPCPDSTGDGIENPAVVGTACTSWSGNVPGKTLAMDGNYSLGGVLQDTWSTPYIYQVTSINNESNGGDFIIAGDMRAAGISSLAPNLEICNVELAAPTVADTVCDSDATTAADGVVAIIVSQGKDRGKVTSETQTENSDGDRVYIKSPHSTEYDDIVKWLSLNKLISKMIEADQLP